LFLFGLDSRVFATFEVRGVNFNLRDRCSLDLFVASTVRLETAESTSCYARIFAELRSKPV